MPRTNPRGFTPIERLDLARTRQKARERENRVIAMTQGERSGAVAAWAWARGWRDDEPLADFVERERKREQTT
jgi:hypothetical protein